MRRAVLRPSLRFVARIFAQGGVVLAGTMMMRLAFEHLARLAPGETRERVLTLAGTAIGMVVFLAAIVRLNRRFREALDTQDRQPVEALRERAYEHWSEARGGRS